MPWISKIAGWVGLVLCWLPFVTHQGTGPRERYVDFGPESEGIKVAAGSFEERFLAAVARQDRTDEPLWAEGLAYAPGSVMPSDASMAQLAWLGEVLGANTWKGLRIDVVARDKGSQRANLALAQARGEALLHYWEERGLQIGPHQVVPWASGPELGVFFSFACSGCVLPEAKENGLGLPR